MSIALAASNMEALNRSYQPLEPISLDLVLPWHPSEKDEQRFKRMLIGFIIAMLALMLVLSLSPVSERQKAEDNKVVAKTKILLTPVTLKPVEPEKPKPKPVPKEEPKVAKAKSQAKSQTPKDTPSNEVTSNGLAAVSDQLSALRNSFDLSRNQKKNVSTSDVGKVEKTARTLLGKDSATKKSDGIKVESDIMLDDRTTLAAHNAASVEGIDQGGVEGGSPVSRYATQMSGERTMESIRYTLEKNKGSIFTLYHQALNENAKLSGKYTFELLIEPNGTISSLKLISSELGDERLDAAILDRIRRIKFKEEDVIIARVKYTYTFIES